MLITKTCPFSNTVNSYNIDITKEQYIRINNRFITNELIQDIVPNLKLWEREFLMTGMSKDSQDAFFTEQTFVPDFSDENNN